MSESKRKLWKMSTDEQAKQYVLENVKKIDSKCSVDKLRKFSEIAKDNSCGECVICREGTYQIYIILDEITRALGKNNDLEIINEIAENLITESSCCYGREVGKVIKNIIDEEQSQFEKHIKRKICDIGVCKNLKTLEPVGSNSNGLGIKRRRRRS